MAIDFPDTPTTNQMFTVGSQTWKYDGEKWVTVDNATLANSQAYDMYLMLKMETN